MTSTPEKTTATAPSLPRYGQMLDPEAKGILVLDEFTLDPAAARKDQHRFRDGMAAVALTMRRIAALRIVIAIVAIGNLPLFLLKCERFDAPGGERHQVIELALERTSRIGD